MKLSATIGEKLYSNSSVKLNCFVCDQKDNKDYHILSYLEGNLKHKSIDGFTVKSKSYKEAVSGKSRKVGGYWSSLSLNIEGGEDVLLKVTVAVRHGSRATFASMYFIMRKGCDVSMTKLMQIPTETSKLEQITIISGSHEVVDVEEVITRYGFKINPMFKHQATEMNYRALFDTVVVKKQTIKKPTIKVVEVTKVTGEKVVVQSIRRRHRKINL